MQDIFWWREQKAGRALRPQHTPDTWGKGGGGRREESLTAGQFQERFGQTNGECLDQSYPLEESHILLDGAALETHHAQSLAGSSSGIMALT